MLNHVSSPPSSSTYKTYVSPRQRCPLAKLPTEKSALKKAFSLSLTPGAFPGLPGSNRTPPPVFSFAHIAKTTPAPTEAFVQALLPGWIYIRRTNGQFQYKYGRPDPHRYAVAHTIDPDAKLSRLLVKYRLAKAQYERNNDVLRLGDYSEYYNTPTLHEQFAEEDLTILKMDYLSSDHSDSD